MIPSTICIINTLVCACVYVGVWGEGRENLVQVECVTMIGGIKNQSGMTLCVKVMYVKTNVMTWAFASRYYQADPSAP